MRIRVFSCSRRGVARRYKGSRAQLALFVPVRRTPWCVGPGVSESLAFRSQAPLRPPAGGQVLHTEGTSPGEVPRPHSHEDRYKGQNQDKLHQRILDKVPQFPAPATPQAAQGVPNLGTEEEEHTLCHFHCITSFA